jgi:hypothetical protein
MSVGLNVTASIFKPKWLPDILRDLWVMRQITYWIGKELLLLLYLLLLLHFILHSFWDLRECYSVNFILLGLTSDEPIDLYTTWFYCRHWL